MTRVILAAALLAGLAAGAVPAAHAEPYKVCVATSEESSGHEGDYICVNLPALDGTGSIKGDG